MPRLKCLPGHLVIGSSVYLSVCPSVRMSVCISVPLTNKVQYLMFWWWYSNQTWTVSSSGISSHFTDITCSWGRAGSKCRTEMFAIFWLCCRWGHPCFTNTCLVFILFIYLFLFYFSFRSSVVWISEYLCSDYMETLRKIPSTTRPSMSVVRPLQIRVIIELFDIKFLVFKT